MRERILTDNGFVVLNREACDLAHHFRCARQLGRINTRRRLKRIAADFQRHHNFFQRSIARTLAQTVDRALNLTRTICDASQRVRDSQTEVIMAVRGPDHFIGVRHSFDDTTEQRAILFRVRIADRVRQVDRCRACLNGNVYCAAQEVKVGTGRVFCAPFYISNQIARLSNRTPNGLENRVLTHFQLMLHVERAGRNESVDTRVSSVLYRFRAAINIARRRAGQAANDGVVL